MLIQITQATTLFDTTTVYDTATLFFTTTLFDNTTVTSVVTAPASTIVRINLCLTLLYNRTDSWTTDWNSARFQHPHH